MTNQHASPSAAALEAGRARLAQDIAAIAAEASDLLKGASARNLDRARDALSAAHAAIRSGSSEATDVADRYVTSHPWRAVGLAAIGGVVLGAILARR